MRLESKKYLFDMQLAVGRLERFCMGKGFEDYLREEILRAAVERQFEIIGEALSRLSKDDPEIAAKIPEHRRIIAFRNILIHGYAGVDDRIVWGVVEKNLPALRDGLRALLDEGKPQ